MGKMSEIASIISSLRSASKFINAAADDLENILSRADCASESAVQKVETPAPPKAITLEEVRAVLAEKSRDGHTEAIRGLLEKHGASKLSDIEPDKYAALLADAEGLKNG